MEKFVSLLAGGFGEREFTIAVIVSVRARCLLFISRRVTTLPNLMLFNSGKTRKKCVLSAVLIGLISGIRRSATLIAAGSPVARSVISGKST
jgi:hypothetical protein